MTSFISGCWLACIQRVCGSFGTNWDGSKRPNAWCNKPSRKHSWDWELVVSSYGNLSDNEYQITRLDIASDIMVEFKHKSLQFSSGNNITFDLFSASYNLAFEYQGEHHFWSKFKTGLSTCEVSYLPLDSLTNLMSRVPRAFHRRHNEKRL